MRYSRLTRLLHWGIAIGFFIAYFSASYRYWLTTQAEPMNWYLLVIHMNVGMLVFLMALAALVLKIKKSGELIFMRPGKLAQTVHYLLYCFLLVIPVSAYVGTGFDFPLFGVVNLAGFSRFEFVSTWLQEYQVLMISFIEPFSLFHRDISVDLIMPVLIAGHLIAVCYHQFIIRDGIFSRMWFGK